MSWVLENKRAREVLILLGCAVVAAMLTNVLRGRGMLPVANPDAELCTVLPADLPVLRAIGGDTLVLDRGPCKDLTVQVVGIDSPEGTCGADAAQAFATQWVVGKPVHVSPVAERSYSPHPLARVLVGNQDYGVRMVNSGLADANSHGLAHPYEEKYDQLAEVAVSERRGAWKTCGTEAFQEQ